MQFGDVKPNMNDPMTFRFVVRRQEIRASFLSAKAKYGDEFKAASEAAQRAASDPVAYEKAKAFVWADNPGEALMAWYRGAAR